MLKLVNLFLMIATLVFCFLKNIKNVSLNKVEDISEDILRPYFFIVFGSIWASIAVQSEGKDGSEKKLQTKPFLGTSFTWYRVLSITMTFLVSFEIVKYSWDLPFWIAATFLIKDYMWFMINPNFGVSKFNKEDIPWHTWVFRLPLIHWICGLAMVATAIGKQATSHEETADGNYTTHSHDVYHETHDIDHEHHENSTILWLYTSIVFFYLILTSVVSRMLEPEQIIEIIKESKATPATFKNKMPATFPNKKKKTIYF